MRQAIITKYLGPTDHKGSRVKATAQAGSITVPWDAAQSVDANHYIAAHALAMRYNWLSEDSDWKLVGGALPDGTGNVYVLARATGSIPTINGEPL